MGPGERGIKSKQIRPKELGTHAILSSLGTDWLEDIRKGEKREPSHGGRKMRSLIPCQRGPGEGCRTERVGGLNPNRTEKAPDSAREKGTIAL